MSRGNVCDRAAHAWGARALSEGASCGPVGRGLSSGPLVSAEAADSAPATCRVDLGELSTLDRDALFKVRAGACELEERASAARAALALNSRRPATSAVDLLIGRRSRGQPRSLRVSMRRVNPQL